MTLAQCLDQYGVLPNEIGYSILKDVALALSYLHQHDPPIIHRDLSANNVLLTCGMVAKISDLGVAKMVRLSPTQMSTMTNGPGTLCYMPPEAIEENARYNCTIDAFSYGVLMVHLFSGQWPFPKAAAIVDPLDDSRVIPQTEADRRQEKLDAIGRDHPLMTLILRCLHNSPTRRPEAVEIITQVSRVAAQFPPSSQNKVELLQKVTSLKVDTERLQREHEVEIQSLRGDTERLQQANRSLIADAQRLQQEVEVEIGSHRANTQRLRQEHEAEITSMRTDAERLQQEHQTEIRSLRESSSAELESTRQTLQAEIRSAQTQQREAEKAAEESQRKLEDAECCYCVKVEQLNLRLADTRDTLSSRVGEVEAELRAAQQLISSKSSALSDRDKEVVKITGQMAELRQEVVEKQKAFEQHQIAKYQELVEKQKEFKKHLFAKKQQLVEKQNEFDKKLIQVKKEFVESKNELKLTLITKDQLLTEKEQRLSQLTQQQTEFEAKLQSKEEILSSKESLVASKDSIIGGLQEQLDHLRKSHTAQVSVGV